MATLQQLSEAMEQVNLHYLMQSPEHFYRPGTYCVRWGGYHLPERTCAEQGDWSFVSGSFKGNRAAYDDRGKYGTCYLRAKTSKNAYFSRINAADKAKFREHLALLDMGLEDRMKQPVGLLSGGQRQALTLLMATMVTPKILLLDEHTAALDPATAKKSARPDQTDRCREKDHLPYGNPQYAPGIRTWKPYPDDGFRKYHLRCERRKTCGHDGGGSVRAVCGLCRKAFGQ